MYNTILRNNMILNYINLLILNQNNLINYLSINTDKIFKLISIRNKLQILKSILCLKNITNKFIYYILLKYTFYDNIK